MHEASKVRLNVLDCIAACIESCTACGLHKERTNVVPGVGNPTAELVFFGEGPGFDEDQQGLPFVGRAGKMLSSMLAAMGWSREDVFIMNAVKCRPPGNRKPLENEIESCRPFFQMQLETIQPKAIVALGATAMEALCGPGLGITKRRGKSEDYVMSTRNIPVFPTFHPAYLLRNPAAKPDAWRDLEKVKEYINGAAK
jgi:uracil-DNA glycosylase family 4